MHTTNRYTAVSCVGGAHVRLLTVETQVVGVSTIVRRRTPNEAANTYVAGTTTGVAASGRKKHICIRVCLACEFTAIYTIDGCQTVVSIINQVLKFIFCWHPPATTQYYCCSIKT